MRNIINKFDKDYYGGGLMILIGLIAILQGRNYKIGTMSKMGSGFFPVALGAILVMTGLMIALTAKGTVAGAEEEDLTPEWRGWICITLSIVAFVVIGRYGGLLPATFAIVFISAIGDRQNTMVRALVLSFAMVAVAVVVFWWALQLQFPLYRWG